MIYLKREEAVAAAKEKAKLENKIISIIRRDSGWAIEDNNNSYSITPSETMCFINNTGEYNPINEPELESVIPIPSDSSSPPGGVDIEKAILLLQWVTTGMEDLAGMKYRVTNQTYTNFAKDKAVEIFLPAIKKLHGCIGDNLSEKCIGFSIESLRRLFLKKSKISVQIEITEIVKYLNIALERLREMKRKKVGTHCGIKWKDSYPKGTISLETWQKSNESGLYGRVYTGNKTTYLSESDWTDI